MLSALLALMLVSPQLPDHAAVTRDLTRIEEQLAASWKSGDCDGWSALIAPEWSVIHLAGTVVTKNEAMHMCRTPQARIDTFSVDQLQVRVFDMAAVVTGRTTVTTTGANADTVRLRFTDVFIRRDGRWQVVASQATSLATEPDQTVYKTSSLPNWAGETLRAPAFSDKYDLHYGLNPYYLRGDFDGDGAADVAVLIRQRATQKTGIAFVHSASRRLHIVGAGSGLGNGGDDFSWLGAWRVESGAALKEVPRFRAEVLFVEKPEAAGALLYWNGKRYQWVQRGD